jgi:hypothetical protein
VFDKARDQYIKCIKACNSGTAKVIGYVATWVTEVLFVQVGDKKFTNFNDVRDEIERQTDQVAGCWAHFQTFTVWGKRSSNQRGLNYWC